MKFKDATDIINEIILNAINSKKSMHQPIVDAIVKILDIEINGRCVLYFIKETESDVYCEITAGYPNSEKEHGLFKPKPLDSCKDLLEVSRIADLMHIKDPMNDPVTADFRDHVINKKITEIIYLPIIYGREKRLVGIIVIDGTNGKIFTDEEVNSCAQIGDLISSNLNFGEEFISHTHDQNNVGIWMSGFLKRIKKKQFGITGCEQSIRRLISGNGSSSINREEIIVFLDYIASWAKQSADLIELLEKESNKFEDKKFKGGIINYDKEG